MKVVTPKPFTYEGGDRAVLLLHGFTGSTVDVRKLGRFLQKRGYTCHAPLYKGHGVGPDQLIQSSPEQWWEDVKNGYALLKNSGYEQIAVAGVSLGAVFSLKLAAEHRVNGVVSMCAPMQAKSIEDLTKRVHDYALSYKKIEGKDAAQIEAEIAKFKLQPMLSLNELQKLIVNVSQQLKSITIPTFVLQGLLDEELYINSAKLIYDDISTMEKQLKWYEKSGHIITLGKEREQIVEDVSQFLETLDWG
ncbi:alpha/beta fold hydrolase [Filobacillus milosensis]|uniref:Alpha/beta fold hydrolase n=1 Tax=Filobacillus milosensis TaxID=94137 RepID=A0A4Y8IN23_9BACI|nr:alpha/beta fold hydrolase [Filobacillus milosensis]TFB22845.1 alpha/beta fold hydrolase [Filobacillus milosensis]